MFVRQNIGKTDCSYRDTQRPMEATHGDLWRPVEFDWLIFSTTVNEIIGTDFDWIILPTTACRDLQRPMETTWGDLQRSLEFDWLIFPTTFNDIIGTDFDWLIFPLQPIRSLGLNNLINKKSCFFSNHLFEKSTQSQNR